MPKRFNFLILSIPVALTFWQSWAFGVWGVCSALHCNVDLCKALAQSGIFFAARGGRLVTFMVYHCTWAESCQGAGPCYPSLPSPSSLPKDPPSSGSTGEAMAIWTLSLPWSCHGHGDFTIEKYKLLETLLPYSIVGQLKWNTFLWFLSALILEIVARLFEYIFEHRYT